MSAYSHAQSLLRHLDEVEAWIDHPNREGTLMIALQQIAWARQHATRIIEHLKWDGDLERGPS